MRFDSDLTLSGIKSPANLRKLKPKPFRISSLRSYGAAPCCAAALETRRLGACPSFGLDGSGCRTYIAMLFRLRLACFDWGQVGVFPELGRDLF